MDKLFRCTIAAVTAAAALIAGGCTGKNADPETQEVIKITITPEPTPTTVPEEVNPDAVVTNGAITMTNSYLLEGSDSSAVSADDGESLDIQDTDGESLDIQDTDGEE